MINGSVNCDGHEPDRATWDCRRCGAPFPCDPAREALTGSLPAAQLAIHAWELLEAAVFDLVPTTPPAGELFDRFIRWTGTHPASPTGPPCEPHPIDATTRSSQNAVMPPKQISPPRRIE